MTRRRVLYAAVGLTITACIVGAGLLYWNDTAEAERAFDRIALGMRPAEVERAIGEPANSFYDVRSIKRRSYKEKVIGEGGVIVQRVERWGFPQHTVWVSYDFDCKVSRSRLIYHEPGLLDRLRELVRW